MQQEEIQKARNRHVYLTDDLQETFQQLQQEGPPEPAWDVLAPGTCESEASAWMEGIMNDVQWMRLTLRSMQSK